MVEQTHELRLKIDAAAAEAGAKRFTAATDAIRRAVAALDREADGTFSKLARHRPEFDVTPLTRASTEAAKLSTAIGGTTSASDRAAASIRTLALQSANALRVSTDQASRLRDRLLSLDSSADLSRLDAGLAKLRSGLIAATSGIDVREARAGYADLASDLNRTAREAERLRAIANAEIRSQEEAARAAATHGAQLEALALKYNPLRQQSLAYAQALEEISRAESAGVLSAQLAEQARSRAAQSLLATSTASEGFTKAAHGNAAAISNVSAQFQDVVVMMAAGQNPFQLAMQQGTQLSAVLNQMSGRAAILRTLASGFMQMINPISLVTIGVIAAGAAIVNWMTSGSEATMSFGEALSDADSKISAITRSTDTLANAKLGQLAEGYGRVNEELRIHLERLVQIAQLEAVSANRNTIQALEDSMTGGWLTTDVDDIRTALDTTNDGVRHFLGLLNQIKQARTFEEQATAISTARRYLESTGITLDNAQGAAQELLMGLIKAEDSALRLKNAASESDSAIAGAVGQTNAWASAMSGVRAEINAILSSLSVISGGVISNSAKSAELTALQAGKTVREAEVARLRYKNEAKLSARQMAADAKGGVAGCAESMLIRGERAVWERGISLDDQLTAEREKARKRETSTTGGGGGGGRSRAETLGDEERALSKLTKSMNDRIVSLDSENAALMLLATGQAKTEESARFMADAMAANGGALDDTTMAIVRQYEAASVLNEQLTRLARDPVKKFMDSVPDWQSAAKDIQASMTETFSTTLADSLKTGEFDATAFADALFAPVFDAVAKKATKELFTALGATDGSLFGGLFESLGLSSIGDPDAAALASGAGQAGSTIATSMVQAGQQVAASIQSAMTGAGHPLARLCGLASPRAGPSRDRRSALPPRPAALCWGAGVVQGSAQGAPILAQGVAAGAQSGGILSGVGGLGGLFGMILPGLFKEGGYSTSPVTSAAVSPALFRHAPAYAEGTANTSGIPALLHDNEAVIPLSRGRKIGVELNGDSAGGGQVINMPQYFTINTPDADSFRRSQKQVAADMATAGSRAARDIR